MSRIQHFGVMDVRKRHTRLSLSNYLNSNSMSFIWYFVLADVYISECFYILITNIIVVFRLKLNYIVKDETETVPVTFWDSQSQLLLKKTAVQLMIELPEVLSFYFCFVKDLLFYVS